MNTSLISTGTVFPKIKSINKTIDLYLSSEERYEIWTIKVADRPELLERHDDINDNHNYYSHYFHDSITTDKKDDSTSIFVSDYQHNRQDIDFNDEKKCNDIARMENGIDSISDSDNDTDDNNQSADDLPISDGCDIPGWRHYGLTHANSSNDRCTRIIEQSIVHSIGQGCTLLRKESQLPGMKALYQLNQQQQSSKFSKWEQVKERLLSSSSHNSLTPIQRISYNVKHNNDVHSASTTTLPLHSWFERDNVPVLIEGCCTKDNGWDLNVFQFDHLVQNYGSDQWRFSDTHGETTTLYTYAKYIQSLDGAVTDDSPLAIYDSQFGNKNSDEIDNRSDLLRSYTIPTCFDTDLYRYIDNIDSRPPYRWILIGPERSGTGLHIDPVGTHAWVTLTQGCKKWILFPPDTCKDDIGMIQNQPQIPSSIWFTQYYDTILKKYEDKCSGIIECVQYPGETIYVPAGWPHIVLNLELSVAVTENYATEYPSIEHLFSSLVCRNNENYDEQNNNTDSTEDESNILLAHRLHYALQNHRPDLKLPSV
jgi:JmjC domain, hydroxylase